jgi:hypothetical protein
MPLRSQTRVFSPRLREWDLSAFLIVIVVVVVVVATNGLTRRGI